MSAVTTSDLEFIAVHERIWAAKPFLRQTYARYHQLLLDACPPDARVLELGCGIGKLGQRARAEGRVRWISTDVIAAPGASLRCDGTSLPVKAGSLDNIVFVDVLHHLRAPLSLFREAARALRPG